MAIQVPEQGQVQELLHDVLDEAVPLATVLRKALWISQQLNEDSMVSWIRLELNGYPKGVERPEYRKVRGTINVDDAFAGIRPVRFAQDDEWAANLATVPFHEGVAALTDRLQKSSGQLVFMVPEGAAQVFIDEDPDIIRVMVFILDSGLVGVLHAIRQRVYDWLLSLQARGISGSGHTFARPSTSAFPQVINQVNNRFENISNSQIMSNSSGVQTMKTGADLTELLEILREAQRSLSELGLPAGDRAVAEEDVTTSISQASSATPRIGILKESIRSVRTVLEGVAGNVIASNLLLKLDAAMKAAGISL